MQIITCTYNAERVKRRHINFDCRASNFQQPATVLNMGAAFTVISAILLLCTVSVLSTSAVCDAGKEGSTCASWSRKPLIAGNWKMNTDLSSASKLAADLVDMTKDVSRSAVDIALFPPFPFIRDIWKVGCNVVLGDPRLLQTVK